MLRLVVLVVIAFVLPSFCAFFFLCRVCCAFLAQELEEARVRCEQLEGEGRQLPVLRQELGAEKATRCGIVEVGPV